MILQHLIRNSKDKPVNLKYKQIYLQIIRIKFLCLGRQTTRIKKLFKTANI